jgi:magnesium chelatase subunit I
MTISAMELLHSNLERRAAINGESTAFPRLADVAMILPAITGKVEMVYEGEQQGSEVVGRKLIGTAVAKLFQKKFPPVERSGRTERDRKNYGDLDRDELDDLVGGRKKRKREEPPAGGEPAVKGEADYDGIIEWFMKGNKITLSDEQRFADFIAELRRVPKLEEIARKYAAPRHEAEVAFNMELILEALHQALRLSREDLDSTITFAELMKFNVLRTVR